MHIDSTSVALLQCAQYEESKLKEAIDLSCGALDFMVSRGTKVLLKPNLLTGRSADHLACTHPAFVAAAAKWFIDRGAKVAIGDSPAFGTAKGVMRSCSIEDALTGLPVERINFDRSAPIQLAGGVTVNIAQAALDCDMLVNLPRVKAHSQLYMTLAVKNFFGTVVGFQKPLWHLRYGNHAEQFAAHLVDLLTVLPPGVSLIDGVVAMAETGPVSGKPYPLGLVAGAVNPVALDTALLTLLGLDHSRSGVWHECAQRGLAGADPERIAYPLLKPVQFSDLSFKAPSVLKSVSFNPVRMIISGCRRFVARAKEPS